MSQPTLLTVAGSSRTGSLNQRLADAFAELAESKGHRVVRLKLADYSLPLYSEESIDAAMPIAERLASAFNQASALFIGSPEFNGSLTPLLKNALDWVSRVNGNTTLKYKPVGIGSVSTGQFGGIQGLGHLRQVLTHLGALVPPDMVAVHGGTAAFDAQGHLVAERHQRQAAALLVALERLTSL